MKTPGVWEVSVRSGGWAGAGGTAVTVVPPPANAKAMPRQPLPGYRRVDVDHCRPACLSSPLRHTGLAPSPRSTYYPSDAPLSPALFLLLSRPNSLRPPHTATAAPCFFQVLDNPVGVVANNPALQEQYRWLEWWKGQMAEAHGPVDASVMVGRPAGLMELWECRGAGCPAGLVSPCTGRRWHTLSIAGLLSQPPAAPHPTPPKHTNTHPAVPRPLLPRRQHHKPQWHSRLCL